MFKERKKQKKISSFVFFFFIDVRMSLYIFIILFSLSVCESSNDHNKSIFLPNRPTIRITEYDVDCLSSSSNSFDDIHLSDTFDPMDDENI